MSQTLTELLNAIRDDLRALPEMRRVYDSVPDAINEYPAVVVAAPTSSSWLASHGRADGTTAIHSEYIIRVEVHIPLKDVAANYLAMNDLSEAAKLMLYSGFVRDRYSGTMITTATPQTGGGSTPALRADVSPSQWAGQDTLAALIDFRMTMEQELTP